MFAPHWSAFLEGNYMDFGSTSRNLVTPVGTVCQFGCGFSTKATATTVLVGVNYNSIGARHLIKLLNQI